MLEMLLTAVLAAAGACPILEVTPVRATAPVADDADDPAIWVHPVDPARSLIVGTNKIAAPGGALVVFGLDGAIVQTVGPLDRPNNVDIEQGCDLGAGPVDLVVTTERLKSQLRVYRVDPATRRLVEITAVGRTGVFAGEDGPRAECMGLGLYRRPRDGAVFAVVSRKAGPSGRYLWQYRLTAEADGRVAATKVREFGIYEGGEASEIEAVAVDDELGYVYYSDELRAFRKYHADPDAPDADRELAAFGRTGLQREREGLAILPTGPGRGYIVGTDQIPGGSVHYLFRREGSPTDAHDHSRPVLAVRAGADQTDGIDICARPLGPDFPAGLMVIMNSGPRNFLLVDPRPILAAAR